MKCRKKKGYDCFYLTRDNINEFLNWFNNLGLRYKYDYIKDYENYLFLATKHDEEHYNDFEFYYDYWYVFNGIQFLSYNDNIFKKIYDLVEDKEM